MMDVSHTLPLSQSQAEYLAQACATFRSYAWQQLDPSEERNRLMKAGQAMQGKLSDLRAGGAEPLWLTITEDERSALRVILRTLIQVYGAEPASPERNQALEKLATLRILFERVHRPSQVW